MVLDCVGLACCQPVPIQPRRRPLGGGCASRHSAAQRGRLQFTAAACRPPHMLAVRPLAPAACPCIARRLRRLTFGSGLGVVAASGRVTFRGSMSTTSGPSKRKVRPLGAARRSCAHESALGRAFPAACRRHWHPAVMPDMGEAAAGPAPPTRHTQMRGAAGGLGQRPSMSCWQRQSSDRAVGALQPGLSGDAAPLPPAAAACQHLPAPHCRCAAPCPPTPRRAARS